MLIYTLKILKRHFSIKKNILLSRISLSLDWNRFCLIRVTLAFIKDIIKLYD